MADRKFSQFTDLSSEDLLGTDFMVGYRGSLDNIRSSLDDISNYSWNNFPLPIENGSLIGFNLSGNLANIKLGTNLSIDEDGFLNSSGGGGGNVIADGTGQPGHLVLYTTDGYHVTNSPFGYSTGSPGTLIIGGNTNLQIGSPTDFGHYISILTNTFSTYLPSITSGNDTSLSVFTLEADKFIFNLDAAGDFYIGGPISGPDGINTVTGEFVANYDITSNVGSSTQITLTGIAGNSAILLNNGAGLISFDPDNNYITTPSGASFLNGKIILTVDESSNPQLQFSSSANSLTWDGSNLISSISFNAAGSTQSAYKYALTGTAFDGSSSTDGIALLLGHNSAGNRQFWYTATDYLASPNTSNAAGRFIIQTGSIDFSCVSTDGTINLPLSFQQDFGPTRFGGYVSIGNSLPSAYKFDIQGSDASFHLDANLDIPDAPLQGVVFFSQYDVGLGHSLGFLIDDAGNVTQIGEGSGGGGTVTEVDVTDDLTVNGTPSGSFTVDGTIGLAPTTVTADTYNFGNGFITVDLNGRLTDAQSATDIGTVTEIDVTSDLTVDGTPAGTITTSGTIGLADVLTLTPGTYDFAAFNVDQKGRVQDAEQRGMYDNANHLIIINGTGISAHTGLTYGVVFGESADASDDTIANFCAIGQGARAGNQGTSVGDGAGNGTSGHNTHLFVGYGSDATTNGLVNVAAIGPNSRVSADNTYSYGDASTPSSHGFNTPAALSTLHVVSGNTSGTLGSKGVSRLNGIPTDLSNNWPVSDKIYQQNALITTTVSTETILSIPISNALGGCITFANIEVSGILSDGTASGAGQIRIRAAFDGVNNFYINGLSNTTPVNITLDPGTTAPFALPAGTASAAAVLTNNTGPGAQSVEIQVTGINATTINWIAWVEYYFCQATSNALTQSYFSKYTGNLI
jgi:hypothetical protein